MPRPFGYSREAVWLTVPMAAIAALIATLADPARPRGMSRAAWLRALAQALATHLRFSG